jgi:uncharacterized membrane protein required for colicin V production
MILSVIALLMIILVAAFWLYQGLFSALIMLIETVIACMLAFGFYESVNSIWSGSEAMRDIGPSLAMMLILLISLAAMRQLTDRLVPDAVTFPLQIDRAGAAACGLLTGMTLVGTALVAIQMFPFESSVLGFSRFDVDREGKATRNSLLLRPDGFTLGMVQMLSDGRFGGGTPFGRAKPDLLGDLYWVHNGPQREAGLSVPSTCLRVQAYWDAKQINRLEQNGMTGGEMKRTFTAEEPSSLNKFLVCRVTLDSTAVFPAGQPDIRFRVSQFRLIGPPQVEGQPSAVPEVYPACGMSDLYTHKELTLKEIKPDQPQKLVRFSPRTDFLLNPTMAKAVLQESNRFQFDVVFEVPESFEPWYIEFKQGGKALLEKALMKKEPPGALGGGAAGGPKPAKGEKKEAAAKADKDDEGKKEAEVGEAPAGRTHVADAIEERTGATADLPMILDASDKYVQKALKGGKLWAGHFYTEVSEKELPADSRVTAFEVPKDKRLVQIGAEQNMPESLFGRALNYAAKVAAQPRLTTGDGTNYFAIGVYSAAKVGGKMIFEIQYWPEAETPDRCLKEAKKVNANVMKDAKPDERKFGYIFLVDPGAEIVSFSTTSKGEAQKVKISVPE